MVFFLNMSKDHWQFEDIRHSLFGFKPNASTLWVIMNPVAPVSQMAQFCIRNFVIGDYNFQFQILVDLHVRHF